MPKRATDSRDVSKFDLKGAREARSLSQTATADILIATQSSVSRWEIDGTIPAIYKAYWDLYWKVQDDEQAKQKQKQEECSAKPSTKHKPTKSMGSVARTDKQSGRSGT